MQFRTWLAAAFLAVTSGPVLADGHATLNCADLDPTSPGDAYRAFECISAMDRDLEAARAKITALEGQLAAVDALSERLDKMQSDLSGMTRKFVPAVGEHPETKAIVAYYSAKGEKACPKGWVPYEEAKDRFVIGAGRDYPAVGFTDGEASVTLTVEQMPAHSHRHYWGTVTGTQGTQGAANLIVPDETNFRSTGVTGAAEPHNNMPPFIALYFCQRSGN